MKLHQAPQVISRVLLLGRYARTRVTYDQLTQGQWVQGYVSMILDSLGDKVVYMNMLNLLMLDSSDFGWPVAKGAFTVLLCKMENGELTWHDSGNINKIRRTFAQRIVLEDKKLALEEPRRPVPCKHYQISGQPGDHDWKHLVLKVIGSIFRSFINNYI